MKTALINVKIEKTLKTKAQKVAGQLGLPLGTIVNNYLRRLIEEKQVIFSVPEVPNKKTAALLRQASRDFRTQKNIAGPFTTGEEMDRYLNSSTP
ncbi:MAG: hypothetical protein AAB677_00155 [Patescibacteria group bacterium]